MYNDPLMPSFLCELIQRAWSSSVTSMGTTTLAIVGLLVYPLAALIRVLRSSGWNGLRQHWKEQLKYSAIVATCWWGVLFSYQLFHKVPKAIRIEAQNIKAPVMPTIITRVPLPSFWDAKTHRSRGTSNVAQSAAPAY